MESEVAATATATSTPVRKRLSESMEEVAGDGGEMTAKPEVAVADDGGMGSGAITGLPKTKRTNKGRVRFGGVTVIEIPRTKRSRVRRGGTIIERPKAKPAEIPKRTKTVKKTFLLTRKVKYIFENRPTKQVVLRIPNELFTASLQRMIDFEKDALKQFETRGYAVYERDVEVTDDEGEDEDPLCGDG